MTSKLATTKVAALFVTAGVILGVSSFALTVKADAASDLQAQIAALTAQIAALSGGQKAAPSACFTFTTNLKSGSKNAEVMQLQKFLNSSVDTQVASVGAGSPGNETSTFGPATKRAVIKFQEKYAADILTPVGLTMGNGNWYAGTRAKANSLCSTPTGTTGTGTTGGVVTPTGAGVSVMAATQPTNSLAPKGASRVPFTTFTLTNNSGAAVTVNGVTVQRTGLAADAAFSGVVLVDQNGMQMGVSRTFDSNHQATVGDTFTLAAGASATFTVAGNMAASETLYSGQVASISVVGINTSVPVSGALPISGAQQTINDSLTMGTVTVDISSFDPQSAVTKHIGDTAVRFTGARFTAGSAEDLKFYSIRFRINGSVGSTDLSNAVIVVNGTSYPAVLSTDGRYYAATFPGGILITKGNSVDAYLQADITGSNASGRIAEFDIDRTYDAYFVGQTYGYGIQPAAPSAVAGTALLTGSTHATRITSSQPYFQGSTVSIQGGTATTIQNSPSVAAQNIAINIANQPLGGMDVNFMGEPVTVQSMVFQQVGTTSVATANKLTSVSLVDSNGAVVAGPVDQGTDGTITFSNSITFPVGAHTYTLKGRLPASSSYSAGLVTSMQFSTTPSEWTGVQGQTTGNSITLGTSLFTMSTMTVRGSSLAVSASANPSAQTIVRGGQGVLFANIQLDASQSGEDVRLSTLPINVTAGASSSLSSLSTCQVFNGTTALNTGSNVLNDVVASSSITFDNAFTVTKGTVATLGVKCNLSSSAATGTLATYQFGVGGATAYTGTGATSGNTVTASVVSSNSGLMTIAGTATLVLAVDYSSPSYSVTAGGTTGVILGSYRLRASNEAVNLQKLGLTLTGAVANVSQVYLYNGSTLIGTAVFTSGATHATSTLSTPLNLPKDTDVVVTIKADLASIGTGMPGSQTGETIKIDPYAYEANGVASGAAVNGASDGTITAGIQAYHSFPTVALGTLPTNGVADGRLIRFAVTADSHGPVGLSYFKFSFASSSVTLTTDSLNLFGYTDAGYSTPISGVGTGGLVSNTTFTSGAASWTAAANQSSIGAVEIPAGQTYYFQVTGTVSGSGTSYNLATTLLGDAATTSLSFATTTGKQFVWSPNTTVTAASTTADWTGGAGLVGLPSSGIVSNRTN